MSDTGAPSDADQDGGDSDAAPLINPGFGLPTAPTTPNQLSLSTWTEIGAADWTCLDTPSGDQPSIQAISLSGRVTDFHAPMSGVGNATVTAFPGSELNGNSGMGTSSNAAPTRGEFALSLSPLPGGTTRYGFRLVADGYVETYRLNEYLLPTMATQTRDQSPLGESTANALTAAVGVTRSPVLGLPPQTAPAYVQVWGYRSAADLTAGTLALLAQLPTPIGAGAALTVVLEPRRL
jgi:hypothetical protein